MSRNHAWIAAAVLTDSRQSNLLSVMLVKLFCTRYDGRTLATATSILQTIHLDPEKPEYSTYDLYLYNDL